MGYKTASWVVKVDVDAVFLPSRLTKKLEPDGASKRHLFRELQVRQLWLLWQFGGVLTGCLHHVACEHRLLQRLAEAQLEGRRSEWQVRSHGRGPLRADLLGRA